MAGAWFTDLVGVHSVFGAFILGAAMPRGVLTRQLQRLIGPLTLGLFIPLFFVYSGLHTRVGLVDSPSLWLTTLAIFGIACLGKGVACWLAARLNGASQSDALGIGTLMNARGMMELILLNIGRERGLITPTLFTILVLMTLGTTLMATPLFGLVYRPARCPRNARRRRRPSAAPDRADARARRRRPAARARHPGRPADRRAGGAPPRHRARPRRRHRDHRRGAASTSASAPVTSSPRTSATAPATSRSCWPASTPAPRSCRSTAARRWRRPRPSPIGSRRRPSSCPRGATAPAPTRTPCRPACASCAAPIRPADRRSLPGPSHAEADLGLDRPAEGDADHGGTARRRRPRPHRRGRASAPTTGRSAPSRCRIPTRSATSSCRCSSRARGWCCETPSCRRRSSTTPTASAPGSSPACRSCSTGWSASCATAAPGRPSLQTLISAGAPLDRATARAFAAAHRPPDPLALRHQRDRRHRLRLGARSRRRGHDGPAGARRHAGVLAGRRGRAGHRTDPRDRTGGVERLREPAPTTRRFADGGFLTGDLGHLGDDGRLRLQGRVSGFVNVAGRKVQPDEVERVLREHPLVADARVFGLPDERSAANSWRRAWCPATERSGWWRCAPSAPSGWPPTRFPRSVVLVPELPRDERGKVSRRALEALVGAGEGRPRRRAADEGRGIVSLRICRPFRCVSAGCPLSGRARRARMTTL